MSAFDVDPLLEPLSEDVPCGEDLVYDPAFQEMERAAEGKAEQQFGDTVIPAEAPEWRSVKELSLDLFSRTRDLRTAVFLTRSALVVDGLEGLSDGLELIHGLLDRFWDTVHPKLDPDDDDDPTERVNALISLSDPETTLRSLSDVPLVSSRGFGRFSWRDIQVATGKIPAPEPGEDGEERSVPTASTIDGAFMDCDGDELQESARSVERAAGTLQSIETLLADRIGVERTADLGPLASLLDELKTLYGEQQERRGMGGDAVPGEEESPEPDEAEERAEAGESGDGSSDEESGGSGSGDATTAPPPPPSARKSGPAGAINSREDAIRALDRVSAYFRRTEPSSPVPILVDRAKRLVDKTFMEILNDLTPDGVSQAEMYRGSEEDD